jgi:hypothetical protein
LTSDVTGNVRVSDFPQSVRGGKLVGYVVGTWHEDFLAKIETGNGWEVFGYARQPGLALRFERYGEALEVVRRIDKPGVDVCPLYDCGQQWVVLWPEEWGIAGNRGRQDPSL